MCHFQFVINRCLSYSGCRMASTDLSNFVCNGKKIIGAAFNFQDSVRAGKIKAPKAPVFFLKPTSSYIQEGQDIVYPKVFERVAYEVELGVIIGKKCKNVSVDDAMSYVGGYCLALDLTAQCEMSKARANNLPWIFGKGFDTASPVSKFIPESAIPDPHNVDLWLKVNGELKQKGNTKDLIFNVPEMISSISNYMTLEPNDLIMTGTPEGASPFAVGDTIECGMGDLITMRFNVQSECIC